MAKNTPDRIIDTPETPSAGRASQYSAGATPTAVTLADHTHDGTANSGGALPLYATAAEIAEMNVYICKMISFRG